MFDWLARRWTPRAMWIAVGSLCVTTVWVVAYERQFSASMNGLRFLDTYPWLPPAEKSAQIEAFGAAGRMAQKRFWALGSVHSLVEYSTATLAAVGLGKSLALKDRHWRPLVVAAMVGLSVELIENVALLVVVDSFPDRLPAAAWAATGITLAKFAIKLSLWGVLVTLFAVWLLQSSRSRGPTGRAA